MPQALINVLRRRADKGKKDANSETENAQEEEHRILEKPKSSVCNTTLHPHLHRRCEPPGAALELKNSGSLIKRKAGSLTWGHHTGSQVSRVNTTYSANMILKG